MNLFTFSKENAMTERTDLEIAVTPDLILFKMPAFHPPDRRTARGSHRHAGTGRTSGVEVLASTFDKELVNHLRVAEAVLEHAKSLVETGQDVVILLVVHCSSVVG
jgi:hypothetical protein